MRILTGLLLLLVLTLAGCHRAQTQQASPESPGKPVTAAVSAVGRPDVAAAPIPHPASLAVHSANASLAVHSAKKTFRAGRSRILRPSPEQIEARHMFELSSADRLAWAEAQLKAVGVNYDRTHQ